MAAGAVLFAVALVLALVLRQGPRQAVTVTVTVPGRTTTTVPTTTASTTTVPTTTAPTTTAPTTTAPVPPPPSVPMSWDGAGAIIWHAGDAGPTQLGETLHAAGFGWVALYLGGPGEPSAPDPGWLYRFELASGLPIGGWSVLGDDPATDAATAAQFVAQDHLAFYIADAEAPYGYTQGITKSAVRYARSQTFVTAFRKAEPTLPAGVSSYCRPDEHDINWSAWVSGGFVFLPQAYVNDFGADVAPAACVQGAAHWFAAANVHPTVASYSGTFGFTSPARFAQLLAQAHTTGFSIYPAEVGMTPADWQTYGDAITKLGIAKRP